MAFKIVIKPIIWLDVEDAILWYELKNTGLGKRFFNSFDFTIEKIQQNSKAYKKSLKR